jgi:Delta3-Delta2-enoyl-CoA isomerase
MKEPLMPHLHRDDEAFVLDLGNTENRLHPDRIADINTKLDQVEATESPRAPTSGCACGPRTLP